MTLIQIIGTVLMLGCGGIFLWSKRASILPLLPKFGSAKTTESATTGDPLLDQVKLFIQFRDSFTNTETKGEIEKLWCKILDQHKPAKVGGVS